MTRSTLLAREEQVRKRSRISPRERLRDRSRLLDTYTSPALEFA